MSKSKKQFNWKRSLYRFIALFFIIYAFADMTVLQEYCGNEALGIPPYAQQLQAKKRQLDLSSQSEVGSVISQVSHSEQTPDEPVSFEECFCCCSHTTIGFNLIKSVVRENAPIKQSEPNFSNHNLRSDSHLVQLYQPPKFA